MKLNARLLTPPLALAALLVPGASAQAGVYGGDTDQYDAFVLITKPKTVRPAMFVIGARAQCRSGAMISLHRSFPIADLRPVTLRSRGRFSAQRTQTTRWGRLRMTLTGHIGPRFARGTLKVALTGRDPCTSGTLNWSAMRSLGRIYGGATSQDEPIVIRRSGGRIGHVDVNWHAECKPDGYAHIPDGLTDFPLKASGAFESTWTVTDETGRWDRSFSGVLTQRSGGGTFQATLTRTVNTCSSPPVSWQVESG